MFELWSLCLRHRTIFVSKSFRNTQRMNFCCTSSILDFFFPLCKAGSLVLVFWVCIPPGKNNLPRPSLPFMWMILRIAYAKGVLESIVHSSWVFCNNFCSANRHVNSHLRVIPSGLKRITYSHFKMYGKLCAGINWWPQKCYIWRRGFTLIF